MDDTNSLIEQRKAKLAALRVVLLSVVCMSLTGCFDTKQEITLNPDGTGKVVIESVFAQTDLLLNPGGQPAKTGSANSIRKLIEEAEGVDGWRDISFVEQADGRTLFRGTAYFSDFARFKFGLTSFARFKVTSDKAGHLTITRFIDRSVSPYPVQRTNEVVTAESIQRERAQFRSAMPLLDSTLGRMKSDTKFSLPGIVTQSSNLETNQPSTLRIRDDGSKCLQVMEAILFDTSLDSKRIAGDPSVKFPASEDLLNEKLYGQKAPIFAVIKPGRIPLFDYATEVAEAQKEFSEIAKMLGLGIDALQRAKPAVDGASATITVTGIQWRFDNPLAAKATVGDEKSGYSISLQADLPGPVFSVNKVQINRAITMEGANLQPQTQSWNDNPRLGPGGTNATFTVRLNSPSFNSKGLAEVSGFLECTSAENLRTVELVSGKLHGGTKGAEFGAQIDEIRPQMSGGEKMVLRTTLASEKLHSLKILGDAGQSVMLEKPSRITLGQEHIYTYRVRHEIPRSGKLVAEVLTGTQTLRIPFSVTNVTLLGQPQPK